MTTREASEASRSDEMPKSGTPEQWARLEQYRTTVSRGGGLTLHGWDDFDRLERHLDRPAYEARMEEGRRRSRMKTARELSIADLRALIAEKEPTAQFALEQVAIRMQMRVDAITERGGETVGISLGFAREIVRAINAVCSVSDGDPEGRDLGLGAKPASAVGSEADETPHPHPLADKGVESLIERLKDIRKGQILQDGSYLSVADLCREAATALEASEAEKEDWKQCALEAEAKAERLTRERDEARADAEGEQVNAAVFLGRAMRAEARAEASEAREASLKAALEKALPQLVGPALLSARIALGMETRNA